VLRNRHIDFFSSYITVDGTDSANISQKTAQRGEKLLPLLVPKVCHTLISDFDELPLME